MSGCFQLYRFELGRYVLRRRRVIARSWALRPRDVRRSEAAAFQNVAPSLFRRPKIVP